MQLVDSNKAFRYTIRAQEKENRNKKVKKKKQHCEYLKKKGKTQRFEDF